MSNRSINATVSKDHSNDSIAFLVYIEMSKEVFFGSSAIVQSKSSDLKFPARDWALLYSNAAISNL